MDKFPSDLACIGAFSSRGTLSANILLVRMFPLITFTCVLYVFLSGAGSHRPPASRRHLSPHTSAYLFSLSRIILRLMNEVRKFVLAVGGGRGGRPGRFLYRFALTVSIHLSLSFGFWVSVRLCVEHGERLESGSVCIRSSGVWTSCRQTRTTMTPAELTILTKHGPGL